MAEVKESAEWTQRVYKIFKDLIDKHGGEAGFFSELYKSGARTFSNLNNNDFNLLPIILRLIKDTNFRSRVLAVLSEKEKELLGRVLEKISLWAEANPTDFEWAQSIMAGPSHRQILQDEIPDTVNDFSSCRSVISLNGVTQQLNVKSVIGLVWPKKELGGERAFVTTSSFIGFLRSVSMMLTSIKLNDAELSLLRLPEKGVNDSIGVIEGIEKNLQELKDQLKKIVNKQ